MKTIFIIDGTSGIWKSDLINFISNYQIRSTILKKYSTREQRPEEKQVKNATDLKFVDEELFNSLSLEFKYVYDGYKYGFSKKELEDLLVKYDNVFVIIRNLDLIQEFSNAFPSYHIVRAFIYTDFEVVSKRIPGTHNLRHKKSIQDAFQDYIRHPDIYDEIIINGGSVNEFNRLLESLLVRAVLQHRVDTTPKVSEQNTMHFCKRLATKKANGFITSIIAICALLWAAYIYLTEHFEWNVIEPRFSIITIPILSIGFVFLWYRITKQQFSLNPKELHSAIVEHYENKYLKECRTENNSG